LRYGYSLPLTSDYSILSLHKKKKKNKPKFASVPLGRFVPDSSYRYKSEIERLTLRARHQSFIFVVDLLVVTTYIGLARTTSTVAMQVSIFYGFYFALY
jgi:hypothetical protein